jgi:hypothetical protein
MALLPYAKRVANQRTRPPRDGRPSRSEGEGAPDVDTAAFESDVDTDETIDDATAGDDETAA